MTPRPRKRRIAGLALVVVLGVSGCTFHPGSAAVVNGSKISQDEVDGLVGAACEFTRLNRVKNHSSDEPASSVAFFKHLFTQDLISFAITEKAAQRMHLTVTPAAVAKLADQSPVPAGLDDDDADALTDFFDRSARSQLQLIVLGAHLKDASVTSTADIDQADYQTYLPAGNRYMVGFTGQQSVQVNPAYGSWDGGEVAATDGSLSKPTSDDALKWLRLRKGSATSPGAVDGAPANQVCG